MQDKIKRIQEYVWTRHIDGSDHYDHSIDEDQAIATLEEFYSTIGNRNSPDQLYLGILLFERAYEHPEEQVELLGRAKRILQFYRKVTGEDDWDPVEDRLSDIATALGEEEVEVVEPEPVEEPVVEEPAPPPAPKPVPVVRVASIEEEAAMHSDAVVDASEPEPAPVETALMEMKAPVKRKEMPKREAPAPEVQEEAEPDGEAAKREAEEAVIASLEVVDGMQLVPAGTFLFGDNEEEVYLDSYYVDKEPVTNEAYMRFVRETGYRNPRYHDDARLNAPDQPVVGISYRDAVQYARWAGKALPTEQQWEKAARGTDGRPYPWGNDPPGASDATFGLDPREGAPSRVGKSLRNVSPFGVHDTCGNVWEWTGSPFAKASAYLAVRGGSYHDTIDLLQLAFRQEAHPKDKCEAVGFRCVKNIH
ncbi:MAG: SUMF1/EgtB/PvdO family nonheme iron enzyme [Planctomycetota bacterium]